MRNDSGEEEWDYKSRGGRKLGHQSSKEVWNGDQHPQETCWERSWSKRCVQQFPEESGLQGGSLHWTSYLSQARLVYFPISPWSFISAHCRYRKIWRRYLLNASRSFMKGYLVPGSLEASSWSLAISFGSVGLNPLRLHYSLLFHLNISDSDIFQKFEYHFLYLCFWWSVIFKMKLNITFYILLNSSCIS